MPPRRPVVGAGGTTRQQQAAHREMARVLSGQIRDRQGVIAQALDRIGTLMGAEVAVGFTGEPGRASHGSDTVAGVAYENEYGIGVPERPFMRATNARCRATWVRGAGQIVAGLGKGSMKVEQGIRRLGLMMVRDVKQTINSNMQPPNSAATIARKRSSKTLIDTGQMINSVRSEVTLPDGFRELLG